MPTEFIDPRLRILADALEPTVQQQFLQAVRQVQLVIPVEELTAAINAGAQDRLLELIMFLADRRFLTALQSVADTLNLIGVIAGGSFGGNLGVSSAAVQRVIQLRSARLVKEISDGTRTVIRRIINGAYLQGMNPVNQARLIRQVVGLAPNHVGTDERPGAVDRYVADLVDRGVDPVELDRLTDLYTRRLRNYRANSIARTEVIHAQVSGRYEEWRERANRGVLQHGRTWVEWAVTEDDRLCKWCAPMDGQRVRLGELFESAWIGFEDFIPDSPEGKSLRPDPAGLRRDELGRFIGNRVISKALKPRVPPVWVLHPPLHPMCRCDVVLRFDE